MIALLNRFDPYEYGARREEDNLPPGVHGNLGFRESLLFCFGGMTLQGENGISSFIFSIIFMNISSMQSQ